MQDKWIFTIITLALMWILKRWREHRQIMMCTKFPTIWSHIILGFGFLLTSTGTISVINKCHKKFGKNYVCYVGHLPVIVTADPELIKDVFNAKQCIKKPDLFYDRLANAFGRGFITMNDPHWTNERKIVNAAFNNKNLMSFIPLFNEEANRVLQNIDNDIAEKLDTPLIKHFREFTLHIATRTTIGRNMDKIDFSVKQFATSVSGYLEYSAELMFNNIYVVGPIRKFAQMTYFKKATEMLRDMKFLINQSLNGFSTKRGVDPSYETDINIAVEYMSKGVDQNKMNREHVTGDMVHIFLGAFETTSTSLYYILLALGMYPEYQQRAYEEVCNIFPDDDDGEFVVTYEDLGQLVYIDMIMNETMRVLPIIPHAAREVVDHDLTLSNGIVLPKGQILVIDIYSLHRCKKIWGPDAYQFNPDNFLPTNIDSKHPYSFIPFTKGLRFCIGWRYAQLSIKLTMAKLIKRYKFTTNCRLEDLHLENHVTTHLKEKPQLILERRKNVEIP